MTTWRRYYFAHEGGWNGDTSSVETTLQRQTDRHWWYLAPILEIYDDGIKFEFTVAGRDQWWCHRRAMFLASVCYWAAGLTDLIVPEPTWIPLSPHTNRGRARKSATPVG